MIFYLLGSFTLTVKAFEQSLYNFFFQGRGKSEHLFNFSITLTSPSRFRCWSPRCRSCRSTL